MIGNDLMTDSLLHPVLKKNELWFDTFGTDKQPYHEPRIIGTSEAFAVSWLRDLLCAGLNRVWAHSPFSIMFSRRGTNSKSHHVRVCTNLRAVV